MVIERAPETRGRSGLFGTPCRTTDPVATVRAHHPEDPALPDPGGKGQWTWLSEGVPFCALGDDGARRLQRRLALQPCRRSGAHPEGPSRAAEALLADRIAEFRAAVRGDAETRPLDLVDLWGSCCIQALGSARRRRCCGIESTSTGARSPLGPNVIRIIGEGLCIQGQGKFTASMRTISMVGGLTQLLRVRRSTVIETPEGLVFSSVLGKLRDPSNTEADWRANRDRLGFPGGKSHGFRKTVATVLDQAGLSAREIAKYLGHENPSLTQDVYMSRTAGTIRAAADLDSLLAWDAAA